MERSGSNMDERTASPQEVGEIGISPPGRMELMTFLMCPDCPWMAEYCLDGPRGFGWSVENSDGPVWSKIDAPV